MQHSRRLWISALMILPLASCGFQLRGSRPDAKLEFNSVHLEATTGTAIERDLRQSPHHLTDRISTKIVVDQTFFGFFCQRLRFRETHEGLKRELSRLQQHAIILAKDIEAQAIQQAVFTHLTLSIDRQDFLFLVFLQDAQRHVS